MFAGYCMGGIHTCPYNYNMQKCSVLSSQIPSALFTMVVSDMLEY